jgi:hypothetical protein
MNATKIKISELLKDCYQLNFTTVLVDAYTTYKKTVVYAGLLLFVFAFVFAIVASIALATRYTPTELEALLKPENFNFEKLTGNSKLLFTFGSIAITTLLAPMMAGMIKMAYCAAFDEAFRLRTVFSYYASKHALPLLLAAFIIGALNSSLSYISTVPEVLIVTNLIAYLILFSTFLTIPLIIFGNLNAIEAIVSSVGLFAKQPLLWAGLVITSYLLSIVGVFLFYIGLFITLPFLYAMYFSFYRSVIGFEDDQTLPT